MANVDLSFLFDTYNAAYAQDLFERFLQNPASVDEEWRRIFERGASAAGGLIGGGAPSTPDQAPTDAQLIAARAAGELVDAYRLHGHRAARLDPLGSLPPGHPQLEPEFHGITTAILASVPASMVGLEPFGHTIGDVLSWLQQTYTGPIGYEFEYLEDPEKREWLREGIEGGAHRQPLAAAAQRRLLDRLTEVEAFEQFLHRAYIGAKRFSIEGTDMMVPMLDLAIERAATAGAAEVAIGMAHRGRLNVLAHVLGVPWAEIIGKFEGRHAHTAGTGDVKYHLGAEGTYATASGTPLTVRLAPNPSHLEFVNPVVEGMARARQTDRTRRVLSRDEDRVVPILIHGDAAFSGQGVVAETLNLARLEGYRTGGTLHIIANNQIGFTTDPSDGRSVDYASDLARGFDIPIFHVNADDPEACLAVVRLAMSFRSHFHSDVLIDLIGYRRYGHNEGDEPAYTQPVMYRHIGEHPTVRQLWADRLVEGRVLTEEDVDAHWKARYDRLVEVKTEIRASSADDSSGPAPEADPWVSGDIDTSVPAARLLDLDRQLHAWPPDFHPNPKLARQLERRAKVLGRNGGIDWGHAESLAVASLLTDGVPIRITGQDAERGTFSHRHFRLHDVETGARYTPLANLDGVTVPFELHNSPLSELAAMGFEYGYSVIAPRALVLWEAQFGDFVNGAQVVIDQFLTAGRQKWNQLSRLVLLLPHGLEGQGPEHSSARLERFLQSAAEDNIRVANCTTPAQYFHLLRRQALDPVQRPLVVMTPKSLLRHPRAVSALDDLTAGTFRNLIVSRIADRIERLLFCTGKIAWELDAALEKAGDAAAGTALVRVEQLYPFPTEEAADLIRRVEGAEIVWVQEEPRNMGAWSFIEDRFRQALDAPVRYIGRPGRASPAEGYAADHETEQNRIVGEAVSGLARKAGPAQGSRSGADSA
ncbi:MAG: 2-oxoglutarate dehydrogenase E1 component [Gemmatimonadota bacterium]|jgi:2-oxoglutarate dehydrogenase E1 component